MELEEKEKEKKITLLLEDLTSLEDYIHDLLTFSPLPICFISPLGVILEINPAFEKVSGFSSDEIIGESIGKLFKEEAIGILSENTLKRGSVEGEEMIFFPKSKKEVVTQVFTKVRKDEEGGVVGYFLGVLDITKIKQGEKEVKQAQTALLNILDDTEEARQRAEEERNKTFAVITNFADGLLFFDAQKNLSLINPQAEALFDVKTRDLTGRSIQELKTFPTLIPFIQFIGLEIKGIFRKEFSVKENLVLEVTTAPVMFNEKNLGTLIILHDITREKMIEKMKTEFVSISAHQLRTPLSAIKWTLKMLLDGDLGEITKEQRAFIDKTYRSNERMINLVNDLLNISRIEEGRYLYRPTPTNIEPLIESVINSYKEEMGKRGLQLEFEKPETPLPQVAVDSEKITLAIQNFIENAIRYTLPGGKVMISLKYNQKEIEFSVKDTGIGIPENQKARLFTKFFRAANVAKIDTEGSGLGLFITKNIIEAHGGRIWFESEENKGSTFYFALPVALATEKFEEFLKRF